MARAPVSCGPPRPTDGGDRIWSLLNLELWHRTFIDHEGVQTLPHADTVAEVGSAAAA